MPFQHPPAEITDGTHDCLVFEGLMPVFKSAGDIFCVCVEFHVYLCRLILRQREIVERIVGEDAPRKFFQNKGGVVGIVVSPVKLDILADSALVDGCLERESLVPFEMGERIKLLCIKKRDRSV